MEHSKKLMLVDPMLYRPSMREKTLSKLDEEIERTLNGDLTDEEKAIRYITSARKYRQFDDDTANRTGKNEKSEKNWDSEVLQSVPTTQQYKAKRLLDSLKRNRDTQIGNDGEFIFKQQPVYGSHITDLIGDVLQKSSTGEKPSGWKEFAESLKESKVPHELIVNQERWKHMHPVFEQSKRRKLVKRKDLGGRDLTPSPKLKTIKRTVPRGWLGF